MKSCKPTHKDIRELLIQLVAEYCQGEKDITIRNRMGINAKFPLPLHSLGHLKRFCDSKGLKCSIVITDPGETIVAENENAP